MSQSEETQISEIDRLRARLVLALARVQEGASQVSVEDLIALRQGTLSDEARESVLQLLDSSPMCYEEWLALNRFLDEEEARSATLARAGGKQWRTVFSVRNLAAAAALVALAVALTLLLKPVADLGSEIDRVYALAISQSLLPARSLPLLANGVSAYAFSGTGDERMEKAAFVAGIWRANHELKQEDRAAYPVQLLPPDVPVASLPDDPWSKTRWSVYSETARWLVLITQSCRGSGVSASRFWLAQKPVLHRIRARLAELALEHDFAKVISGRLDQIDEAVGELAGGARADRSCARIEREVQSILDAAGHPVE